MGLSSEAKKATAMRTVAVANDAATHCMKDASAKGRLATTDRVPQGAAVSPARFADLPGLSLSLLAGVAALLGPDATMTSVQAATLPPLLAGRDVVAKARTGTGKTLAFMLPTLQTLLRDTSDATGGRTTRVSAPIRNENKAAIRALVLSPTRELAQQICVATQGLLRGTNLRAEAIVGGVKGRDATALRPKLDVLVATPGRLVDHIENTPGFRNRLSGLKVPLQAFWHPDTTTHRRITLADKTNAAHCHSLGTATHCTVKV